ncbi:MAG TPA: VOC family protein, partial [Candidatus Dormibacteraeota bacterium]|nr:VOC family protein [Candidatus Dormibacteraeota bacterium]
MTITRIDHVGITVSDLDRALGFYRDLLGLHVLADSTVSEPEVADLLGLDSVQIRIADLDSGDGRIVELIQYLQPEGTRIDFNSADPATAHIAFTVDDLDSVRRRLIDAGATIVSRRPITISEPGGSFDGAICLYVRDPDGAILELVQR